MREGIFGAAKEKAARLMKGKGWLFDAGVSFASAFASCFFSSTALSPLYPATNCDFINLDANFFLYSATLILNGKIPYLEVYDHKGLYHLGIDCLGLLMGGRYGVWALEIVFSFFTILFLLRSMRVLSSSVWPYAVALGSYLLFHLLFGAGNSEGEWVLPFVAACLFFYLKGLTGSGSRYFLAGSFFAGLEVGLSLNSRPLDALWGGAAAVAFFIDWLRRKKDMSLLWNALIAIGGALIPYAIIIPIALKGGYLEAMFEAIFVQSAHYIGREEVSLETWILRFAAALFAVASFFVRRFEAKRRPEAAPIADFLFSVLLLSSLLYLPTIKFTSHLWSGISFYALYVAYFSVFAPGLRTKAFSQKAFPAFCALALLLWDGITVSLYYGPGLRDFSYSEAVSIQQAIAAIPEKDRNAEGQVFALDCDAGIYLDGGIIVDERFFCNQSWWALDNDEVLPEVRGYLEGAGRPKWLIVSTRPETKDNFGDLIAEYYAIWAEPESLPFGIYEAKS